MNVILFMAASVDGIVARTYNDVIDWTSSADKKNFSKKTKDIGVVIMGHNTYTTMGKPLPDRLNIVMTNNCNKFDIDSCTLFSSMEPVNLISYIKKYLKYNTVALIGGPVTNLLFLKNKLITQIQLTIAPKLFGNGVTLFTHIENMDINLSLRSYEFIGDNHITLTYDVNY